MPLSLHESVATAQDQVERVQADCDSEHLDELAASVTRIEQLTADLMSVVEKGSQPAESDETD